MGHSCIVGLGNPGERYTWTRHNIGFILLDALAEKQGISWKQSKKYASADFHFSSEKIHLLKPLEFMNLSGNSVAEIVNMFKVPADRLLVVHDEVDIPFGKLKNKIGGGTAGHNGLKDIVDKLGHSDFHRLRFGVGKPEKGKEDVGDYVLSPFFPHEKEALPSLIQDSLNRMQTWMQQISQ